MQSTPKFFGIAANRFVAFVGPYISVGAGVVATWLTNHVHLFATFHVGNNAVAHAIAQAGVFGVTTLVVWLGHQKWLSGFQAWAYKTTVDISKTDVPSPRR